MSEEDPYQNIEAPPRPITPKEADWEDFSRLSEQDDPYLDPHKKPIPGEAPIDT